MVCLIFVPSYINEFSIVQNSFCDFVNLATLIAHMSLSRVSNFDIVVSTFAIVVAGRGFVCNVDSLMTGFESNSLLSYQKRHFREIAQQPRRVSHSFRM